MGVGRIRTIAAAAVLGAAVIVPLAAAPTSYGAPARPSDRQGIIHRGFSVTIDRVSPTSIRPNHHLNVSGVVTNDTSTSWLAVQVYLLISYYPARTQKDLEYFAAIPPTTHFGTPISTYGLFAQIGDLSPGTSRGYHLSIPFTALPISGTPGVYYVAVSVLGGTSAGRDNLSDARADTLVPLLPSGKQRQSLGLTQATVFLPITAPVKRWPDGTFLDESLAGLVSPGGRLSNVLNFALHAPRDSLTLLVDPAVLSALQAMTAGYGVDRTPSRSAKPTPGTGQEAALDWLTGFHRLASRETLLLLPWGDPATDSVARHRMGGVVKAAVRASQTYSVEQHLRAHIVGWQDDGRTTKAGIELLQRAHVDLQLVSTASLPQLQPDAAGLLPSRVSVPVHAAPVRLLVAGDQVASEPVTSTTSPFDLRQYLVAEATIRSLSGLADDTQTLVALPTDWDPGTGNQADNGDLAAAFNFPLLISQTLDTTVSGGYHAYSGRISPPAHTRAGLPGAVLAGIRHVRYAGRIYTGLHEGQPSARTEFDRAFAMAGSASWLDAPRAGTAIARAAAARYRAGFAKVAVSGPSFVAMSSSSGSFPLTVSNNSRRPITVQVLISADNPALTFAPIKPLSLDPRQHQDVRVLSRVTGSGLTLVRARLATTSGRQFGQPWEFSVRATQIGLVIWIVLAAGGGVLLGAALFRVLRRVRRRHRGAQAAAQ